MVPEHRFLVCGTSEVDESRTDGGSEVSHAVSRAFMLSVRRHAIVAVGFSPGVNEWKKNLNKECLLEGTLKFQAQAPKWDQLANSDQSPWRI